VVCWKFVKTNFQQANKLPKFRFTISFCFKTTQPSKLYFDACNTKWLISDRKIKDGIYDKNDAENLAPIK